MTPVADIRRMSLMPDLAVVRSQSDTSYESLAAVMTKDKRNRRASEWGTNMLNNNDKKLILRPLQINGTDQKEFSNLLYRRLSKVQPAEATTKGVSRSYSVKSVKKSAETRQRNRGSSIPSEGSHSGGVKVKERTVSNRSLPLPGEDSDYCRLRNFSVTSKGVVNRGDSFRSKSPSNNGPPAANADEKEAAVTEESNTKVPSPLREETKFFENLRGYKVLLVGGSAVGKTSMRKQFMTSEYICANDSLTDLDLDQVISVNLNNEESQMEFEEETWLENNMYSTRPDSPLPDAFIIVYSVTDRKSFSLAKSFLSQVECFVDSKAVILVGNKTDLARLRVVSTEEGRSLAKDRGCKFIETSVAINHQVDELLVGTLTQIRIKIKLADKLRKKRESQGSNRRSSIYNGSKASGVLKKILRRACLKSKSCDNLHVL